MSSSRPSRPSRKRNSSSQQVHNHDNHDDSNNMRRSTRSRSTLQQPQQNADDEEDDEEDEDSHEEEEEREEKQPQSSKRQKRMKEEDEDEADAPEEHKSEHAMNGRRSSLRGASARQQEQPHDVIDVSTDDSEPLAAAAPTFPPRRGEKISMIDTNSRSRRSRAPVDYREHGETEFREKVVSPHQQQQSQRSTRQSNGRHHESPSPQRFTRRSSRSESHNLAATQHITPETAKSMGMQYQELVGMIGGDSTPIITGGRRTRASAAAAASSEDPNHAAAASAASAVSEEESVAPRRGRWKQKRISEDGEEANEGDDYQQDEEDEDDTSPSESSDEGPMYAEARPRRNATQNVTYSEAKLARNAMRGGPQRQQEDETDDDAHAPQRGERATINYERPINKAADHVLPDGRTVSDREYRRMVRTGDLPAELYTNGTSHQQHEGDVRRSTRHRHQVQPYNATGNGNIPRESGDETNDQRRSAARRGGYKGGRKPGRSSRRHRRPAFYGDSSSRSSSSSSSSSSDSSSASDPGRKDRRRANRERASIQPLHLQIQHAMRRQDGESSHAKTKDGRLADIDPIEVDTQVDWSSIGGLESHIHALKEMVVLPLLYPELFSRFHVQPPKGVLFYGPPGTGKTLVARALANTCSNTGKKVSFFMRKGADCLSKWVGEAERQLRLLFEQAHKMQPSIIFFDELDGLAPVRSSRQDQIHASIVSTLLALMDGLDSRGQVIVIGATNRVDSIDPALRRPGRFDRELMFALPNKVARQSILRIHTRSWQPPPETHFLNSIADLCVGYCGADLRALCTEATLRAVRRKYPQIYHSTDKLAIDVSAIKLKQCDFIDAMRQIVPASQRSSVVFARSLPPHLAPLLQSTLDEIIRLIKGIFPLGSINKSAQANASHIVNVDEDEDEEMKDADAVRLSPVGVTLDIAPSSFPLPSATSAVPSTSLVSSPLAPASALVSLPPRPTLPLPLKPRFLLHGINGAMGQSHFGPAVLHHFEEFSVYSLDLPLLLGDANAKNAEESCVRIIQECKRNAPAVLYWPHIDLWWSTASESLQNTILMLLFDLPPQSSIFLFVTSDCEHKSLPSELLALFPLNSTSASSTLSYAIPSHTREQIHEFFKPILNELKREIPRMRQITTLEQLPVIAHAPNDKPSLTAAVTSTSLTPSQQIAAESSLTPAQLNMKLDHEDQLVRLQRMSLRSILQKLIKQFPDFVDQVSLEDHPDYLDVIAQRTCLQSILAKVNEDPSYDTVKKVLSEIDLLVNNAKEYSAAHDNAHRAIVNKACHLQDCALSMVSQLETKLVQQCSEISLRRAIRRQSHEAATAMRSSSNTAAAAATTSSSSVPLSASVKGEEHEEDTDVKMDIDEEQKATKSEAKDDSPQLISSDLSAAAILVPTTAESTSVAVAAAAASSSFQPSSSPLTSSALLPPPPPIQLDLAQLKQLHADLTSRYLGSTTESIEHAAFQFMKIVISYQKEPNRNDAIKKIRLIMNERN